MIAFVMVINITILQINFETKTNSLKFLNFEYQKKYYEEVFNSHYDCCYYNCFL